MCEIFGLNAKKDVQVNDLLKKFYAHSCAHPHGWGMAVFQGQSVNIEKEPVKASDSAYLKQRLRHKIVVRNMLAHIRYATIGVMDYENTHPFTLMDESGRWWTMVHNGTIFDYPVLSPFFYKQDGTTDSERILYYIVDRMNDLNAQLGRPAAASERFILLDSIISDMSKGNKLNLILYDGELMYAHTNFANSLHVYEDGEKAVIATVPLTKEGWKRVPFCRLVAYKDGERVLEGTQHGHEYIENKRDLELVYSGFAGL